VAALLAAAAAAGSHRRGQHVMEENRAYILGDGRIVQSIELVCSDDEDAKESAKSLANGHDVELWQLGRMIGTFEHKE
jgi:hypothetical protein